MTTRKMTTDSTLASHTLRPRILGAAGSLLLVLTACSGSASSDAAPEGGSEPTTAVATPTTTAPSDPEPVPQELLEGALAAYAEGYEFKSTTIVNDQEVSSQAGRWMGGSSQITVKSGDGQAEFIITQAGQWTRLPGGEWEELDGAPATGFPLEGMESPGLIALVSSNGAETSVLATYPAEAVGLSGELIDVLLQFTGKDLTGFSFTADIDGTIVTSDAQLNPLTDTTPITAPAG